MQEDNELPELTSGLISNHLNVEVPVNDPPTNICRLCGMFALHVFQCNSHCKSWYCDFHATEHNHDCYERGLQIELFEKRRRLEENHGFVKSQRASAIFKKYR